MGFWGSLWSGIKKVAKTVVSLFGFGDEEAERTSRRGRYDSNSASVEETRRINEDLSSYKNKAAERAETIESELCDNIDETLDSLIDDVQKINGKEFVGEKLNIPIKTLKADKRKITKSIKGSIKREITPLVSLDNAECREILEMSSGREKEKAMKKFMNKSMNKSLQSLQENIAESVEDSTTNIEEILESRLNSIETRLRGNIAELENIKENEGKDIESKEESQIALAMRLSLLEYAQNSLEKEKICQ